MSERVEAAAAPQQATSKSKSSFFFFFAAECARAPVGAKTAERTLHLGSDYLSARPWWTCTRALAVQFLSSSRAEPGLLYT